MLEENRESEVLKNLIDDRTWETVAEELDHITENFTIRLALKYSILNKDDIHFCCLLKMGFKYLDIARLCGRTLSMMYKRRNLVVDKIKLKDRSSLEEYMRLF